VSLVRRTRGITPEYGALLRAEIAQGLFSQGRDAEALHLAEAANMQAHGQVGLAPWIAGLSAWRLGRTELSRGWFEIAYQAPILSSGTRAGAAFWAGRASMLMNGDHGVWMRRAAQDSRTFYGLLARHLLQQSIAMPEASENTLGEADVEAVATTPRGERAFGLLQVGQPARAAAELRLLWAETRDQPGFSRSIRLVAGIAGLTELAVQLDGLMQPAQARLPSTRLRPTGGFRFDPALVYALTRLESNFDPTAISPAGARGLMQLLPSTAEVVLAGGRGGPISLHDPATNLDIGQRYLKQLTQMDLVGTDLIRLLVTYNAGPGNLIRWLDTLHEDDPLLFIEALPLAKTRAYVPRALTYSWLYAAQLGLPSSSLDELANGSWPTVQLATPRRETARLH
ncbi:MAG: lytic transglycosylase domain-containing protein, partial [Janthinobacterium lividum]